MKKTVIAFILGLIVMGTITTVAYSYNAKDISYTPSNNSWNVSTVKGAIDSIKNTNDTTITSLQNRIDSLLDEKSNLGNNTVTNMNPSHTRTTNADVTVQLSKGKNICTSIYAIATNTSSANYADPGTTGFSVSGCDSYTHKGTQDATGYGGSSPFSNGYYHYLWVYADNFICTVNSNKSITATYASSNSQTTPTNRYISCTNLGE